MMGITSGVGMGDLGTDYFPGDDLKVNLGLEELQMLEEPNIEDPSLEDNLHLWKYVVCEVMTNSSILRRGRWAARNRDPMTLHAPWVRDACFLYYQHYESASAYAMPQEWIVFVAKLLSNHVVQLLAYTT